MLYAKVIDRELKAKKKSIELFVCFFFGDNCIIMRRIDQRRIEIEIARERVSEFRSNVEKLWSMELRIVWRESS